MHPRRLTVLGNAQRALLAAALVFASGCGSSDAAPADPVQNTDPCASLVADCLINQQACVVTDGTARCEPCAVGQYAAVSGSCEPIGGNPMSHAFADFTVAPGEEVVGLCQSWTLQNSEELWVNAVELSQDEASHHSNWLFAPSDMFDGPDGVWPCKDRNYNTLSAALAGGVLYAQSTQAAKEVQKFPNGAAVRIPPYSRIIGDVHLLNTTPDSVTGHAELMLYTLPVEDVKVKLAPFHLTYKGLDIPPHATSRFTGDCELTSKFQSAGGTPLNMKVYYILPHSHSLATRFFVDVMGGPQNGQSLMNLLGFNGEARGRAYDPPVDLSGAEGLSFGCEFNNPRDVNVGWGVGDQEMCELLGFADSTVGFESTVSTADPAGTEGEMPLFTGPCSTLAFLWDNSKPGGPPPP